MGGVVRSPPAGLPEIKAHPANQEGQRLSPRKQRHSLAAQGSGGVSLIFSVLLEIGTGFQHVQAGRFCFMILSFWLLWEMRRSTPSPDLDLHSFRHGSNPRRLTVPQAAPSSLVFPGPLCSSSFLSGPWKLSSLFPQKCNQKPNVGMGPSQRSAFAKMTFSTLIAHLASEGTPHPTTEVWLRCTPRSWP